MSRRRRPVIAVGALALGLGVAEAEPAAPVPDATSLRKLSARLTPVDVKVDVSKLPADERAALARIVAAAKIMDSLFLRQVWPGNEDVLLDLAADPSPLGRERLHAFLQNKGPWLRLDED